MTIELVPLYNLRMEAGPMRMLPNGPMGTRIIVPILEGRVEGERVRGSTRELTGDWLTVSPDGQIGSLDVRGLLETDDGALILTSYTGRTDFSSGPGSAPLYGAPTFETGDERYSWINRIQAVSKGALSADLSEITFDVFEVR